MSKGFNLEVLNPWVPPADTDIDYLYEEVAEQEEIVKGEIARCGTIDAGIGYGNPSKQEFIPHLKQADIGHPTERSRKRTRGYRPKLVPYKGDSAKYLEPAPVERPMPVVATPEQEPEVHLAVVPQLGWEFWIPSRAHWEMYDPEMREAQILMMKERFGVEWTGYDD